MSIRFSVNSHNGGPIKRGWSAIERRLFWFFKNIYEYGQYCGLNIKIVRSPGLKEASAVHKWLEMRPAQWNDETIDEAWVSVIDTRVEWVTNEVHSRVRHNVRSENPPYPETVMLYRHNKGFLVPATSWNILGRNLLSWQVCQTRTFPCKKNVEVDAGHSVTVRKLTGLKDVRSLSSWFKSEEAFQRLTHMNFTSKMRKRSLVSSVSVYGNTPLGEQCEYIR